MKRVLSLLLSVVLVLAFSACGSKKNVSGTIKDGKSLQEVIDSVNAKFKEKYGEDYGAVAMSMPVEAQYLSDFLDLDSSAYDEFAGGVSMSMTNSDSFFAIKAKEEKVEVVQQAVEKRLSELITQYEYYPVSGSLERAQAGEVYVKGDYVFLIVVGVVKEQTEESPDFSSDVQMAKETIDSLFND